MKLSRARAAAPTKMSTLEKYAPIYVDARHYGTDFPHPSMVAAICDNCRTLCTASFVTSATARLPLCAACFRAFRPHLAPTSTQFNLCNFRFPDEPRGAWSAAADDDDCDDNDVNMFGRGQVQFDKPKKGKKFHFGLQPKLPALDASTAPATSMSTSLDDKK